MKSLFKKIIVFGIVIFIGIQFYRPHKNTQEPKTLDDFLISEKAPKEVKALLKKSCYDCHSNNTHYYWYDHIAPVSWFVDNHIKEGKEHVNFSNWANLSSRDKLGVVSEMAVNISEDKMPLSSYTSIHSDAKLSSQDKDIILKWLYTIE